jgi:hypothetical protein
MVCRHRLTIRIEGIAGGQARLHRSHGRLPVFPGFHPWDRAAPESAGGVNIGACFVIGRLHDPVVIIFGVHMKDGGELLLIVQAGGGGGLLFGLGNSGQEQRRHNPKSDNHDQQFNEIECSNVTRSSFVAGQAQRFHGGATINNNFNLSTQILCDKRPRIFFFFCE